MKARLLAVLAASSGCGFAPVNEQTGRTCGSGTVEMNSVCVPTLKCGAGTHLEGSFCAANLAGCGAGTTEVMGLCVADVSCGIGTVAMAGKCVASGGRTCGTGTQEVGGVCVSTLSCGAGTTLTGNQCTAVAGAWYDVRIATSQVPADGFTRVQVLAIGRKADGTPALDPIVLTLSRASAGALNPTTATLGALGAYAMFTPCSTTSATCLGPATISLALASSPSVPVATATFDLVTPPGVGSPANCLAHPRAMVFDGTGYIFTGMMLVTQGTFTAPNSQAAPNMLNVNVNPTLSSQGTNWGLRFAAPQGTTLATQVYNGATRWPFQAPTNPGLDVTGDGRGCNQSSGRFQIHTLTLSGTTVTELVATWEQFCENQQTNVLRGCLRYTP